MHGQPEGFAARAPALAALGAALGDETRLALLAKLAAGERMSISQLSAGSRLTRQAVTKHLRVLEGAGMVRSVRDGRETRFEFNPAPMGELAGFLRDLSAQWNQRLARLKRMVETES